MLKLIRRLFGKKKLVLDIEVRDWPELRNFNFADLENRYLAYAFGRSKYADGGTITGRSGFRTPPGLRFEHMEMKEEKVMNDFCPACGKRLRGPFCHICGTKAEELKGKARLNLAEEILLKEIHRLNDRAGKGDDDTASTLRKVMRHVRAAIKEFPEPEPCSKPFALDWTDYENGSYIHFPWGKLRVYRSAKSDKWTAWVKLYSAMDWVLIGNARAVSEFGNRTLAKYFCEAWVKETKLNRSPE